jgi:hypothetical protein
MRARTVANSASVIEAKSFVRRISWGLKPSAEVSAVPAPSSAPGAFAGARGTSLSESSRVLTRSNGATGERRNQTVKARSNASRSSRRETSVERSVQ